MILTLRPGTKKEEVEKVITKIEKLGFSAHISKGKERTIIGVVGAHAIHFAQKGSERKMMPPYGKEPTTCIACGACVTVCPVDVIGLKEEGDERTIIRWNRTLKMKQCKVCGNYFAPWFQLETFREKAELPKDFFDACPSCRESL